ncbi:MAG: 3-deoxy-D-manno-octulosonic acid transferase [Wenzhouxiangella sp.]
MRLIYRLLAFLLTPLALIHLARGDAGQGQSGRWRERLGRIPAGPSARIWLHAASLGEVNAAQGLVRALLARGEVILLSTLTASGAARCRELFGDSVEHRYLALDNALAVRDWLDHAQPRLGLIMETEVWPELFFRCQKANIPLLMINARISESAFRRYARFPHLVKTALRAVKLAVAQSAQDGQRLLALGLPPERLRHTGNLKFDLELPPGIHERGRALRRRLGSRPAWVAGSTRPGEEGILLQAHQRLREILPDAVLVLAPRHPERSSELADLLAASGLDWCRFDSATVDSRAVVLVDRLGLLLECYAATDLAFVGGSLVPIGGHNLLEPAALAKPVLSGPYLQQQAESARVLQTTGGLNQVNDAAELTEQLAAWLRDEALRRRRGAAALAALQAGQGSLQATLQALQPWLKPASMAD